MGHQLPLDLSSALDEACVGLPRRELTHAVDKLIARYRSVSPATQPILGTPVAVTAYAAYRMPATWAAVRSVLGRLAEQAAGTGFAPQSLLDVGGGTGAAVWAAAEALPSLTQATVLDEVDEALHLGKRLAARASGTSAKLLRATDWRPGRFQDLDELPGADLVTVSYVLSELTEQDQAALVAKAAGAAGQAVVVVEPGTPTGHARILAARAALIDAGLSVVAPCPHSAGCPLADGSDWCHFAARVNRSALHRLSKGAEMGHEDEKFSYVVASRQPLAPAPGRILRHPQKRKGLVMFELCKPDETTDRDLVSKRQGELYRAARDAEWGDAWPPPQQP